MCGRCTNGRGVGCVVIGEQRGSSVVSAEKGDGCFGCGKKGGKILVRSIHVRLWDVGGKEGRKELYL